MVWVAGVDGFKSGWVVILKCLDADHMEYRVVSSARDLLSLPEECAIIAIDIPIGLPEAAEPGGRECDRQARKLLRQLRGSSVFPPPVRSALSARDYEEASLINSSSSRHRTKLTRQCFGLFRKLREIDFLMTPSLQHRIKEIHPELSFYALNTDQPLVHSKHTQEGLDLRRRLLEQSGFEGVIERAMKTIKTSGALLDDVLDACAACWSACRIRNGTAIRIPSVPPCDAKGLLMEMWR